MKKALFIFFLIVASTSYSQKDILKVMTFNIRYDNPSDGEFSWENRRQLVFNVFHLYRPDVIGLQEALVGQVESISKELPGYAYIGAGRDDGLKKGEFSAIFYDSSRFTRKDGSTFWLSETPAVPGSKSWNSACTRIVTWVKLSERKSGKTIYIFNTHFDHISEEAREKSAELLASRIREITDNENVIVTGDFNSDQSGKAYQILTSSSSGYPLADTRKLAGKKALGPDYSFIGFPFHPGKEGIIDFIFIRGNSTFQVIKNQVIDYHERNKYPSDHLPVISEFKY